MSRRREGGVGWGYSKGYNKVNCFCGFVIVCLVGMCRDFVSLVFGCG